MVYVDITFKPFIRVLTWLESKKVTTKKTSIQKVMERAEKINFPFLKPEKLGSFLIALSALSCVKILMSSEVHPHMLN